MTTAIHQTMTLTGISVKTKNKMETTVLLRIDDNVLKSYKAVSEWVEKHPNRTDWVLTQQTQERMISKAVLDAWKLTDKIKGEDNGR